MVKVLADFHHGALYYSFHLLFEKRLGWELYRPIGWAWYKRGYWRYSTNPEVIKQYLQEPPRQQLKDGVYYIHHREGTKTYVQKAVTFDKFLEMDFDFIIASVYNHETSFFKLIQNHKPDAILIRQMGNPREACNFHICRNILNSTTSPVPPTVNMVRYHPEFDLHEYAYSPPTRHNRIKNFLNCLPMTVDAPLWYQYKKAMSNFVWKMHGILGENGFIPEHLKARTMRDASFIWHLKSQGDGYGFVVFQSYAIGRPMIVKKHYYKGQRAEPLFEDSVTCIDLDLGSLQENVRKIKYWSQPENHIHMCENAYKRFKELVDFDKEFIQIKKFLERTKKEGEI